MSVSVRLAPAQWEAPLAPEAWALVAPGLVEGVKNMMVLPRSPDSKHKQNCAFCSCPFQLHLHVEFKLVFELLVVEKCIHF